MKTHASRDDGSTYCGLENTRAAVVDLSRADEVTCRSCRKHAGLERASGSSTGMTEERVRQLIREELEAFGVLPALLKTREVADLLNVSKKKVRELATSGKIATVRLGKKTMRFAADSVDAFIENRREKKGG